MLNSTAIATLLPDLSAILPPTSCETADASVPIACTYPIKTSPAPAEVTLKLTKGLAMLPAKEFTSA